jgi:hypothetical protein
VTPEILLAPCQLMTILESDPSADITQTSVGDDGKGGGGTNGVECSRARQMLLPFATTREKLDEIAEALEKGCTKNAKGGGCRVKTDVMWKTLDRVCE